MLEITEVVQVPPICKGLPPVGNEYHLIMLPSMLEVADNEKVAGPQLVKEGADKIVGHCAATRPAIKMHRNRLNIVFILVLFT